MPLNNKEKGNDGEERACGYLKEKGYEIIERNYRCLGGEIDIIAAFGGYIVFIEVKYRENDEMGLPREAVGVRKQKKIRNCALEYIGENEINDMDFRFDVIEILGENIEHIENAF
ncbi:MAG: YraN family protein [Firmicutes bacterium]|nr:YraN family protein [Bacillota bacterium]